jgi:spore coat polysaccharide biosynthesis predicted glycosyltransferase SpsG
LSFSSLQLYYQDITKEEWDNVSELISLKEKKGEIILFDSSSAIVPFDYYYQGKSKIMGLNTENNYSFPLLSSKGFWLILSHNYNDIDYYLEQAEKNLILDFNKTYKGIEVYHFSVMKG